MLSYDPSAGKVSTPHGVGLFIEYLGSTEQVVVELDYNHIVAVPAQEVYIYEESNSN